MKIKEKFRKYQETGDSPSGLERAGQIGSGPETGKIWHRNITKYIENPSRNKNRAGEAVIKALKSEESIVKDIEFLQTEFPLYGFMTKNLGINFWNGKADAIGWLGGKYVIVDWKATDLLNFWKGNKVAYGDYLHQCLVYARLLQLHLGLEKLPFILIVPISNTTGKDIHPALFRDFPDECKKKIEEYKWSKNSTLIVDVDKRFLKQTYTERGVVSCECVVNNLFTEDITVRQLLEALRFTDSKLNVVREDSSTESSTESRSESSSESSSDSSKESRSE